MLDEITTGDEIERPELRCVFGETRFVERGLPSFQIGVATCGWRDVEFERCGQKALRGTTRQEWLLKRPGAEYRARIGTERAQRFDQRIEMAFGLAIADPG